MRIDDRRPSKYKADFKQYGFSGFVKRGCKFLLRKVGIDVNSYYYMVNTIDAEERRRQFEAAGLPPVKELTYEDFLTGDSSVFTEKKLSSIRARLSEGTFKAFGIIENGCLIYSCWISLKKLESSSSFVNGSLDPDEGLLMDAYCSPLSRGRGLHGAMNSYRLWQLSQNGKQKAVVIVLKENKPAFKSQIKVGFDVAFIYRVASIWGKTFTDYYKLKNKYRKVC